MMLYLSDLRQVDMTYEILKAVNGEEARRYRVRGLPLLRAGVFNSYEFTAENLSEIEQTFDPTVFAPPLRPYHARNDTHINARTDILGHIERVYIDDGVLLADAAIYDADTITEMQKGRFRYLSAEVLVNGPYRLQGAAFVDNPAVKGLPWELVMNRTEYPELQTPAVSPGAPQVRMEGGNKPMSLKDKIVALFSQGTPDPEAVLELMNAPEPQPTAEVAALAAKVDELSNRLVQMGEEREKYLADTAAREAQLRSERVDGEVTALLNERYITPATADRWRAILSAAQETVVTLADDKREPLSAMIVAALREGAQIDERYFSQISAPPTPDEDINAVVERMEQYIKAQEGGA